MWKVEVSKAEVYLLYFLVSIDERICMNFVTEIDGNTGDGYRNGGGQRLFFLLGNDQKMRLRPVWSAYVGLKPHPCPFHCLYMPKFREPSQTLVTPADKSYFLIPTPGY